MEINAEKLFNGMKSVYDFMNMEAEQSAVGARNLIFLPFLAGTFNPVPNAKARGVFCGLSLNTKRSDLIRSFMEGCGFALRHIVDYLSDAGFPISELRATGGPAKSDIWNRINCDVSGVPIVLIETLSDASIGDAMIAGVGTGVFDSFSDAIEKTVKVGKRYDPIDENQKKYDRFFKIYLELYESLGGVFDKLAIDEDQ
jgi:xylulokinase